MKKSRFILLIFIALLSCSSCSYLAPSTSKALTEEAQLEEQIRHNKEMERLLKEQNEILKTNHK